VSREWRFEVAVIGGGSAGYAAARTTAQAGLKTAVIEGGTNVGGLCILRGCMPTKALLHAAEVLHTARNAGVWGIEAKEVQFDFAKVMAWKNALIAEFAADREEGLTKGKFEFIRAQARFADPHTLLLSDGAILKADHVVISTGSVVADPPWPSLSEVGYLDSDAALELEALPQSLLVLGGGAVGVEFAQFFARFGVEVTLVQRSEHVLREFDPDAAQALEAALRREGITLCTGTHLRQAWRKGDRKGVTFEHQGRETSAAAEEIFFALGRSPNTAGLDLARAGVVTDGPRIVTDEAMQTNVPHIYAVGDCASVHEIVHIAVQQGETAGHNIARPDRVRRMDYRLAATVVFTDPQVALVGLTEREAREGGIPFLAARYPFRDHGKSLLMNATDGFVKLLADPRSGEILGGCCVGPVGGELIHEIIAAVHQRMTVQALAAMPHYHPTLAEIWTYPAEQLAAQIISE
jgi:dihydrolipoamide dehydrogenase